MERSNSCNVEMWRRLYLFKSSLDFSEVLDRILWEFSCSPQRLHLGGFLYSRRLAMNYPYILVFLPVRIISDLEHYMEAYNITQSHLGKIRND